MARWGISLNLLTLRVPTVILRADACPYGLGRYSLTSGQAWRFKIPPQYRGGLSLNLLEYLASVTTIIVEVEANQIRPEACLLSQLDNSMADYWLHRGGARFQGTEKAIHLDVSRWLATILLWSKACNYSQWIPGKDNVVADSLSCHHHLAPEPLTHLLPTFAKNQLPPNFNIYPLPHAINFQLISWLRRGRVPPDYKLRPKRSSLELSDSGKNFGTQSVSAPPKTSSWIHCPLTNEHLFSAPSQTPHGKPSSMDTELAHWRQQLSVTQSHLYRRPLLNMTAPTQLQTYRYREKLTAFYASNSQPTKEPTQPLNTNRR